MLDSWAVLAYLEDEDAPAKVADIIADAHDEQIPLLMTVVNAGEVCYIVARQTSAAQVVLMAALEHATYPRALANTAKHLVFTRCGELNFSGMLGAQIAAVESELLCG